MSTKIFVDANVPVLSADSVHSVGATSRVWSSVMGVRTQLSLCHPANVYELRGGHTGDLLKCPAEMSLISETTLERYVDESTVGSEDQFLCSFDP